MVHSGLKSRHLEVTKNLYYVFSPTCWSQLPIYLGSSSSWTICLSTLHNFSSAPFPTNLSLLNVKHLDVILSTYLWLLPPMLVVYSASLMGNLDCIQIPTDWAYTHRRFIVFLVLIHQARATLRLHSMAHITFSIICLITPFWFSTMSLEHGDSLPHGVIEKLTKMKKGRGFYSMFVCLIFFKKMLRFRK